MPADEQVEQLLAKAKDDLFVVEKLADDTAAPRWVIGFHAQQAVEKAIKAVLSFHDVEYPRTHNLTMLVELLRQKGLPAPPDAERLSLLTPFGVAFRYETPVESTAELDGVQIATMVRAALTWAKEAIST